MCSEVDQFDKQIAKSISYNRLYSTNPKTRKIIFESNNTDALDTHALTSIGLFENDSIDFEAMNLKISGVVRRLATPKDPVER